MKETHRNRQKEKDVDRRYVDRETQEQTDKDMDRRYVDRHIEISRGTKTQITDVITLTETRKTDKGYVDRDIKKQTERQRCRLWALH